MLWKLSAVWKVSKKIWEWEGIAYVIPLNDLQKKETRVANSFDDIHVNDYNKAM
jgi:hypothetical protein